MGKQTRKELEDLEYYVELAKSRLKDANPALLTFGRVLTALLQDRLATLPEEAKPWYLQAAEAIWEREHMEEPQRHQYLGTEEIAAIIRAYAERGEKR